tara:strand:+ start:135 stop:392 length:258 start_codon:yes stop_codon:yes gene_type:complete
VAGKLTHVCDKCGSTNLYLNFDNFVSGVELTYKTREDIEEDRIREWEDKKSRERWEEECIKKKNTEQAIAIAVVIIIIIGIALTT